MYRRSHHLPDPPGRVLPVSPGREGDASTRTATTWFKSAATRAGLDGLHFHELRHTFATLALESRALDMHELSRAMGHASYAITDKVYAHVRPRDFSAHRAAFSAH